jgi:hypothetical protein
MSEILIPLAGGTKKPPLVSGWTADPPPPMVISPENNTAKRLDDDVDVDLGYDNVRVAKGQTSRVINEAEAAVVRDIYTRFANGEGLRTMPWR